MNFSPLKLHPYSQLQLCGDLQWAGEGNFTNNWTVSMADQLPLTVRPLQPTGRKKEGKEKWAAS